MRNNTGSLFTFLEDVFALRGFGASNRSFNRAANDDLTEFARLRAGNPKSGSAKGDKTRGLSPLVSVAVSVCPVPPVIKQA